MKDKLPYFIDRRYNYGEEQQYEIVWSDGRREIVDLVKLGIVQEGSRINAAILNRIVEEINQLMGTYDTIRRFQLNFIAATIEQETKNNANLTGVDANIVIETFRNLDDINLLEGAFDSVNQKVYLP
ncbi:MULTISPECIES: hypothetical protein [Brevibacillus]|uniref:hypothetical protein n=1 Tax=Brevibacillus TaxID=55080 RepID=UPI000E2FC2AD|nr:MULTISPECIES: hypothetical protein [Brevibacillus]MED1790788.1 hypothetical protein [Brevibacillus laterosporus]RFB33418.1 hypothetical protein DZB91_14430 [Brevibacillus sp. VP]